MIDEQPIWLMARLISTSHGAVIDTRAIIRGPRSGRIGGLGTDVHEEEGNSFRGPVEPDHPSVPDRPAQESLQLIWRKARWAKAREAWIAPE
ncbi:NAD(P)-dependent oxidoreductase [Limimaricola soesokkakensis]|uniref:NAD(P)-dependent oxidoreductase n=1 Tax=Limimaricola soesokkakensis TaxID=1343159 RepID=UPI000A270E9F|nr:NAD(P)-dependent oxidoreductase [Limimaricola soesokkakensis]